MTTTTQTTVHSTLSASTKQFWHTCTRIAGGSTLVNDGLVELNVRATSERFAAGKSIVVALAKQGVKAERVVDGKRVFVKLTK